MAEDTTAKAKQYVNVDPATRRRMLAVRQQSTFPELLVRRMLHALGYRFRLHRKDLPGTPDIVLPCHKKIILVHGCFWHGHENCKKAKLPKNNANTWMLKINANRSRDGRAILLLQDLGWNVLVLWECEVRNSEILKRTLEEFMSLRRSRG